MMNKSKILLIRTVMEKKVKQNSTELTEILNDQY